MKKALTLAIFLAAQIAWAQQDFHIAGGHAPEVIQQTGNVTGSGTTVTATLTPAPKSTWSAMTGTTFIVTCGVNNTGTLAASDNNSNGTWNIAKSQTGTTAGVVIAFIPNPNSGATIVTCTAGTSGVVTIWLREVQGLLTLVEAQPDSTDAGTGASLTTGSLNAGLVPGSVNEIAIVGLMLTTNNACTAVAPWTIDTQQGAVGGRLCPARQVLDNLAQISGGVATFTSASYAMAAATFKQVVFSVSGRFKQWDGLNTVVLDPCQTQIKSYVSITQTSGTQLITGTAAKKVYICSLNLITATTQNIALTEGTGTVCATGIAGMQGFGGSTAGTGWNLSANGGFTFGNGESSLGRTSTTADNVCLLQSGSGQISGGASYVVQ